MKIDKHIIDNMMKLSSDELKKFSKICLKSSKKSINGARVLFNNKEYSLVKPLIFNSLEEHGKSVILTRIYLNKRISDFYDSNDKGEDEVIKEIQKRTINDIKSLWDHKSKYQAATQSILARTSQNEDDNYKQNLQNLKNAHQYLKKKENEGLYSDFFNQRNDGLYVDFKNVKGGKIVVNAPIGILEDISTDEINEINNLLKLRENEISIVSKEIENHFNITDNDLINFFRNL